MPPSSTSRASAPTAKSADIAVFIRINVAVGVPGTTRN